MRDARCPLCLPIVEVVSGEHGAVCGVEVEPPDAVGVQQVHETAMEEEWRMDAFMFHVSNFYPNLFRPCAASQILAQSSLFKVA